ncbi:putative UDP-rhamnose:rhamnosyltransferase 1 [Diospyros lotus]|uniref:putative UDP-rhamnose:rhamnosyltransferase 1 n=1 Tax=Diospyros lotus TaxID=55363 RepID=UPI00224CC1AE|nr:putative UDP-rhamnose:rhamnosyltransferase 1 [Diospyros lotus]
MAGGDRKMHIVVFPWLAFGHMIPFMELAKFMAKKGHKVSFVSTTRNIERLPKLPPEFESLIDLVKLTLPPVEGLQPNAEATTDVGFDEVHFLKAAFDKLEPEFTRFIESSPPDWIIHDYAHWWVAPAARKVGSLCIFFSIMSGWFTALAGPPKKLLDPSGPPPPPPEGRQPDFIPFPTDVTFRPYQLRRMMKLAGTANASGVTDFYRHGSSVTGSEAFALRYCREFEGQWLPVLEKLNEIPSIPVGIMPAVVPEDSPTEPPNPQWVSIKDWLEKQSPESAVYVALGSEVSLTQEELTELAHGLELSGMPFFWALKKSKSVQLPDGFEERIGDRGIVWSGWAPQVRILAHPSVGGFLTHCGWSSTIEGIQFGRPLIMLPFMVDQGPNALLLAGRQLGLEIPRDETDGSYTRNDVAETIKAVVTGKIYREKIKEQSVVFSDKALHDRYLEEFLEFLENHRKSKAKAVKKAE